MQRVVSRRLGWVFGFSLVQPICCLVLLGLLSAPGLGQGHLARATTSRAAREDAIRGIPFKALSRAAQIRIAAVVRKPTMFRRMPITLINCDPELHRFSVRHPEVIVNIWQLMGITQVTATRTAPYILRCNDGVGTETEMELIYGDHDTHVLFCEGSYDGPLFRKPLTGRCVLILKSGTVQSPDGFQSTNMLDVFLQIDHAGVDIFARTMHPLLGKSADVNFIESMRFLERLSKAATNNGEGVQHMAGRLQDLQPQVRDQFKQVVANVHRRYHEIALDDTASLLGETPAQSRQLSSSQTSSLTQPAQGSKR